MTEQPSVWTMDRDAIEETLVMGRSPRRAYSVVDKAAIRRVLDRSDFETMSEADRAHAFNNEVTVMLHAGGGSADMAAGSSLSATGWLLVVGSLAVLAYAYWGYGTSVHSDSDYVAGTFIPGRDTINIGLLQDQLMLFLFGLAGLLIGAMSLLAASVRTALNQRSGAVERSG